MKVRFVFAVSILFSAGKIFVVSAGVPENLLIYLPFNEGNGDRTEDASGNGFDGKLKNAARWTENGKGGSAVEFGNGDNSHVAAVGEILDPISETGQYSLGAYFKLTQHKGFDAIINVEMEGAGCCKYRILVSPGFNPYWNASNGPPNDRTFAGFQFKLNTWYHYVLTYDGQRGNVYVNGKQLTGVDEAIKPPIASPSTLYVGRGESDGMHTLEGGVIDEVFVFSRALVQREIQTVMKEGVMPAVSAFAVNPKGKLSTTWSTLKTHRIMNSYLEGDDRL